MNRAIVLTAITTLIIALTWVPWTFSIISEPKEAKVNALYFSESTMKKNSSISLQI